MPVNSRVRVEYWQDGTKVPTSDPMLYPNGSDILSEVNIDADWTDALWDTLGAAADIVSGMISAAAGNFIAAGFSALDLGRNIQDLVNSLSDRAGSATAALNISYPNPVYNSIHLIFEADSDDDLLGVHTAPPTNPPMLNYSYNNDNHHRSATCILNLDALRQAVGDSLFFSDGNNPHPYAFAFAVRQDATITLSVVHALTLHIFRQQESPPMFATDITYWMRRPGDEIGEVVAQRRLMEYTLGVSMDPLPNVHGWDQVQSIYVSLVKAEDGIFYVDKKPYNNVSLTFRAVSRRKVDPTRATIDFSAEITPSNGALIPYVNRQFPSYEIDEQGRMYQAEGIGIANRLFSPSDVPSENNVNFVFNACQVPGWGNIVQIVTVKQVVLDLVGEVRRSN